jgi:hypothetical protein
MVGIKSGRDGERYNMGEMVGLFRVQNTTGDMSTMGRQARGLGMETKRRGLPVQGIDDFGHDGDLGNKKRRGRELDIEINDERRIHRIIRTTEKGHQ